MVLSSETLSKFAKATKDNKKTNNEATLYGTVKKVEGILYVQFDGSQTLTPAVTTADMLDGERVMVRIKDHTATIVGNISSPAARSDDVKNIKLDVDKYEIKENKVTTITSSNNHIQYPSAKAVYDSTTSITNTELESILIDD